MIIKIRNFKKIHFIAKKNPVLDKIIVNKIQVDICKIKITTEIC